MIFLQFLVGAIFLSVVFLHLTKKNFGAVIAYGIQSLAVVVLLFNSYFETRNIFMLLIALVVLSVKVILAPIFFIRLIKKHDLTFSISTYLNTPTTLIIIAALTDIAHSEKLLPLTGIVPGNRILLSIALSAIFIALFLIVNRKGALLQIVSILSLENSIVAFTIFAGLEQSAALQLGILFNIFIWLTITTVFVSMIYKHFGSLDISSMKSLKD